jgi:hypothetical protein
MNPSIPQQLAKGHRERIRTRFLAGDEASLSEEALLELLLTYSILRKDVKPLAQTLLKRFGTISSVLAAAPAELAAIRGIKENSIVLIKLAARLGLAGETVIPPVGVATSKSDEGVEVISEPPRPSVLEEKVLKVEKPPKKKREVDQPKLQVSNGYLFDSAQNAQLLSFIGGKPNARKIGRKEVMEGTGLSAGQAESLASISVAMGLVASRTQVLTALGRLVIQHDLFLDSSITLEMCHFLGASNPRNLVWFMVFNDLLVTQKPTEQLGWSAWLREKLAGKYSERSLVKHIAHEVRFLLDAYTAKNFKKLGLLTETPEKTLALRRYSALQPLTLAAIIYLIGGHQQSRLVPFTDLHAVPGSPGRVFGLDHLSMRQMVEFLHQREWIRFEIRHGLDQVRLLDGFEPLEFIAAAYENRAPQSSVKPTELTPNRLLL